MSEGVQWLCNECFDVKGWRTWHPIADTRGEQPCDHCGEPTVAGQRKMVGPACERAWPTFDQALAIMQDRAHRMTQLQKVSMALDMGAEERITREQTIALLNANMQAWRDS